MFPPSQGLRRTGRISDFPPKADQPWLKIFEFGLQPARLILFRRDIIRKSVHLFGRRSNTESAVGGNIQRRSSEVWTSMFGVRCWMFDVRCPALGATSFSISAREGRHRPRRRDVPSWLIHVLGPNRGGFGPSPERASNRRCVPRCLSAATTLAYTARRRQSHRTFVAMQQSGRA